MHHFDGKGRSGLALVDAILRARGTTNIVLAHIASALVAWGDAHETCRLDRSSRATPGEAQRQAARKKIAVQSGEEGGPRPRHLDSRNWRVRHPIVHFEHGLRSGAGSFKPWQDVFAVVPYGPRIG